MIISGGPWASFGFDLRLVLQDVLACETLRGKLKLLTIPCQRAHLCDPITKPEAVVIIDCRLNTRRVHTENERKLSNIKLERAQLPVLNGGGVIRI